MRAFIGIALPQAVRSSLAALQQQLAESQTDVKWVEEPNLHVTMRFLGEIDDAQRQTIEQALGIIAHGVKPFDLSLSRLGAFPSLGSPRVIWVGVGQGHEELTQIAKRLEERLVAAGLSGEDREFVAHVTLGRVRSSHHLGQLARSLKSAQWQAPPPWTTTALTLYKSELSSSGPRYMVLAEVPLAGAPKDAAR